MQIWAILLANISSAKCEMGLYPLMIQSTVVGSPLPTSVVGSCRVLLSMSALWLHSSMICARRLYSVCRSAWVPA